MTVNEAEALIRRTVPGVTRVVNEGRFLIVDQAGLHFIVYPETGRVQVLSTPTLDATERLLAALTGLARHGEGAPR